MKLLSKCNKASAFVQSGLEQPRRRVNKENVDERPLCARALSTMILNFDKGLTAGASLVATVAS